MTPTQPPQGVVAELRELLARRSDAAERIARSPINLDDVQAYQDADTAACTAALLVLPGLLDEVEATERERDELAAGWQRTYDHDCALLIAERDALLARCEGLEGERNALSCALAFIRDSTFRDAASLRAHADAVLNKYRAGDFVATRTTGGE